MNQSEQLNELATALAKAQGEMGPVSKNKNNPFHKSMYADLSSYWDAAREALGNNGLSVVQTLSDRDDGKICLTTTLLHTSGQWMRGNATFALTKADIQGYGSCVTYLRRYSFAAMVGLSPDDGTDDDGEGIRGQEQPAQAPKKPDQKKPVQPPQDPLQRMINESELKILRELLVQVPKKTKDFIEKFLTDNHIMDYSLMSVATYNSVVKRMRDKIASMPSPVQPIDDEVPF